jgi:hypothetical protein
MSRFSQGSRRDVRHFFEFLLLRFGHEIRWCFAVSHASQKHHRNISLHPAVGGQPVKSGQQALSIGPYC